jgi:hypothetical protein
MFKSLQILKRAYRNGHITAATEAHRHLALLLKDIEAIDVEDLDAVEEPNK